MFTTTSNPQLKRMHTATAEQLAKFIELKADRGPRFLHAEMKNEILYLFWITKTGFYVQAEYDRQGEKITKTYFRGWNEIDNKPFNPVFHGNI